MLGGFKTQGKTAEAAQALVDDALALEEAGAFSVVLEAVPSPVAAEITRRLTVPTIGIGAGRETDGQVLVYHDLLGLTEGHLPRFVKRYANLSREMRDALEAYAEDVAPARSRTTSTPTRCPTRSSRASATAGPRQAADRPDADDHENERPARTRRRRDPRRSCRRRLRRSRRFGRRRFRRSRAGPARRGAARAPAAQQRSRRCGAPAGRSSTHRSHGSGHEPSARPARRPRTHRRRRPGNPRPGRRRQSRRSFDRRGPAGERCREHACEPGQEDDREHRLLSRLGRLVGVVAQALEDERRALEDR